MTFTGLFRQWTAALVCSIGAMAVGTIVGWPSPVLFRIQQEGEPMKLTREEISWVVSIVYLGNLMSPIPAGLMMERIGRKLTMILLAILPAVSWLMVFFASVPWHLLVARFFAGTWIGTLTTVVPLYLAEIAQPEIRGAVSTVMQQLLNLGMIFQFLIGPMVSFGTLAFMNLVFPLIFILLFYFMPESPYWLEASGMTGEASVAIAWLRGYTLTEERLLDDLEQLQHHIEDDRKNVKSYKHLVRSKGSRKALMIVEVLAVIHRTSGISGLLAFTSTTLPQKNIGFLDVNDCVTVMGFSWFFSGFIATYLVDKLGRRPLLFVSLIGCGVSLFAAGLWFIIDSHTTIDASAYYWIPFASFVIHGIFFSLGIGPVASIVQGEYFATNVKAMASSFTSIVLATASFIMNKIYLGVAHNFGMYLNYWIFSTACFLGAIFVATVVIETKGKTLYEIQEKLSGRHHVHPQSDDRRRSILIETIGKIPSKQSIHRKISLKKTPKK